MGNQLTNLLEAGNSSIQHCDLLIITLILKEQLVKYAEVTEGMENAIWKAARTHTNFPNFYARK